MHAEQCQQARRGGKQEAERIADCGFRTRSFTGEMWLAPGGSRLPRQSETAGGARARSAGSPACQHSPGFSLLQFSPAIATVLGWH